MNHRTGEFRPSLFTRLSRFGKDVNRRIVQSEIEGGVRLDSLDEGTSLVVETENRNYRLEFRDGRRVDLRAPGFLSASGVGQRPRLQLGRLDAQGGLHRPRNAP